MLGPGARFFRDALPPIDRRDRVKVASIGMTEVAIIVNEDGEKTAPATFPEDTVIDEIAWFEGRRTNKRMWPYAIHFLTHASEMGPAIDKLAKRFGSWAEAEEFARTETVLFLQRMAGQGGPSSQLIGYKRDASGTLAHKYTVNRDDLDTEG